MFYLRYTENAKIPQDFLNSIKILCFRVSAVFFSVDSFFHQSRAFALSLCQNIIRTMAHFLCINPWIYDFAAYNLWIEPLGLLTVAAHLRQAGHRVTLIDCLDRQHPAAPAPRSLRDRYGCGALAKVELPKPPALAHVSRRWSRYGLPVEVFEAELAACPRPDAVLVTSPITYWYPGAFEAIRRVKQRWPDIEVALGGVYATLCTDHARRYSDADRVFCGGDVSEVLRWAGQFDSPAVPGTWPDPFPAHDLRRPQVYAAILTARGCPFACPYCAVHRLGSSFAPRPSGAVIDEMAWCVQELGASDLVFYDDALLVNAEQHIHPILDGLIERGISARLHTPNGLHARLIDRPLARKMKQAGFVTLRLGLETADPDAQQRDGGKVDGASFERAARALFEAGFAADQLAAYVLIARPGQRVESAWDTATYAHRLGVPVLPAEFSPIPGTADWQQAVDLGLLSADADPLLHNNSIYPCAPYPEQKVAWESLKREIRHANRRCYNG